MIDDGAEHATGRRSPPEVFRSLCDHSGLPVRQLSGVVQAEGLPMAMRFAVWKAEQRARGRRMVVARRRLVEYYESMW